MSEQINVVSLFSGCGGLDLGIANANADTITTDTEDSAFNLIWSNDAMEHATKSHSTNFGKEYVDELSEAEQTGITYCGDIREINFQEIVDEDTEVNLILGGFPCQDFSILRGDDNRGGIEVERGKLYLEFARSLASLQPEMFVAENVKGLVSANDGKAYETILDDFTNLDQNWNDIVDEYEEQKNKEMPVNNIDDIEGYTILHSEVVDFSNLGVPQGRERLIIIGLRDDIVSDAEDSLNTDINQMKNSFESDLYSDDFIDDYPLSTMESFTGESIDMLNEHYTDVMGKYEDYVNKLDSERAIEFQEKVWPKYEFDIWADYKWRNNPGSMVGRNEVSEKHKEILKELGYWNVNIRDATYPDDSNEEMREQDHVLERLRHIPPGENHQMVKDTEHHVAGMMSNIYKRTHPLEPSPTVIASGGGGTWGYHYERERGKLTNRERARIQTFPEDFTFHGKNAEVRKQIGNAVPPLGAKRVGESIYPILKEVVFSNDDNTEN